MKQIRTEAPIDVETQRVAQSLRDQLPAHLGFTLFVFEQGKASTEADPTTISYVSTAPRSQMIAFIRSWLNLAAD